MVVNPDFIRKKIIDMRAISWWVCSLDTSNDTGSVC